MSDVIVWNDHLYYHEDSPTCIKWARDVRVGKNFCTVSITAGTNAGSLSGGKYKVTLLRKVRIVSRIIYEMFNGAIPTGMVVDHLDGNVLNNKISNLRLVTPSVNNRNYKKYSTNSSGIVGVSKHSKFPGWKAEWIDLDGRRRGRHFSTAKYGEAEAFRLACEARAQAIVSLNQQGAGYTERHGK